MPGRPSFAVVSMKPRQTSHPVEALQEYSSGGSLAGPISVAAMKLQLNTVFGYSLNKSSETRLAKDTDCGEEGNHFLNFGATAMADVPEEGASFCIAKQCGEGFWKVGFTESASGIFGWIGNATFYSTFIAIVNVMFWVPNSGLRAVGIWDSRII